MTDKKTNADLIREEAQVVGHDHSNSWWQTYLQAKHNRVVTIQQIAAVLGRYRDRIIADKKEIHACARRFLLSCSNDVDLAKRILMEYQP